MDFINFVIVDYKRPFVKVKLVCDETKYQRGCFRYTIESRQINTVDSSAIFEFASSCLFLHGDEEDFEIEEKRTQSCGVRSFLGYNTARVITNKYMRRVNP